MGLFWLQLCSNGSRRGWIRLWPARLNWHFRGLIQIFSLFSALQNFIVCFLCIFYRLNSWKSVPLAGVFFKHVRQKRCFGTYLLTLGLKIKNLTGLNVSVKSFVRRQDFWNFSQQFRSLCSFPNRNYCCWNLRKNLLNSGSWSQMCHRDLEMPHWNHLLNPDCFLFVFVLFFSS